MNSRYEPDLKVAMQRLSDVAGPPDLADAALRGAKGMRRRRAFLTSVAALTAVAALSLPFVLRNTPPAGSPEPVSPGFAAPLPSMAACKTAPNVNPSTKEVAQEHWPQYVRTVLTLLPARDDYFVQNTYDLCNPGEAGASNAYTVINLGHFREHGHLTVDLYVYENSEWLPNSCADLSALATKGNQSILFCEDGTGTRPLLYATGYSTTNVTLGAVYADHRAVVMERNGDGRVEVPISVDELKTVVSNQDLLALIPVASEPLPTSSRRR